MQSTTCRILVTVSLCVIAFLLHADCLAQIPACQYQLWINPSPPPTRFQFKPGSEVAFTFDSGTAPSYLPRAGVSINGGIYGWANLSDNYTMSGFGGRSHIRFVEDPALWEFDPGYGAVTSVIWLDTELYVTEVEIVINAAYFGSWWDRSECPLLTGPDIDLQTTVLHEVGHALGLGHTLDLFCEQYSVMTAHTPPGACEREPLQEDINSIIYMYPPYDPAARIGGFQVVNGKATWHTIYERQTSEYVLEGSWTAKGSAVPIGVTEPSGVGFHSVDVSGAGFPVIQLMEIETTGRKLLQGMAKPVSRTKGRPNIEKVDPTEAMLKSELDRLRMNRLRTTPAPPSKSATTAVSYVIFTKSEFLSDVQTYVAAYWQSKGHVVEVVNISTYPSDQDAFRSTLKAAIASYANSQGTLYFHLIGDSNDWREFDSTKDLWPTLWWSSDWQSMHSDYLAQGFPAAGQPMNDIIPTYSVPDTNEIYSMAEEKPYWCSDQDYADVDDDGIPDVVVTRWPVTTNLEVLAMARKMQTYNDDAICCGPYKVSFILAASGGKVVPYADSVETKLLEIAPGQDVSHLNMGPFINHSTTAGFWNLNEPELVILMSTWSDRYAPGHNFVKWATPPWDMSMINPGSHTPLVIAATCGAGGWSWTEDPTNGSPICEDFLTSWDNGAIAWLGPSSGTYLMADFFVALYMVEELFSDTNRPMAESWLVATQRLYTDFEQHKKALNTVKSFSFLGDPLSPLKHRAAIPTSIGGRPTPLSLELAQNVPNPFNPTTRINFSTTQNGRVRLVIYNVKGQLVRTLLDSTMPSGNHSVEWRGDNNRGGSVGSGVYYCRLLAEGKSLARKMVYLK